jgi:hypothetical protein
MATATAVRSALNSEKSPIGLSFEKMTGLMSTGEEKFAPM